MFLCFDIANYFLSQLNEDAGDVISNLKLQKLLYYAQGFHLALYNKPLFKEEIEAWQHGPVITNLYHRYKDYGSKAIPIPKNIDFSIYDKQTRELLDETYQVFGQFSAWKLRNMTHQEDPWITANSTGEVISHDSLKEYFKTQLNK